MIKKLIKLADHFDKIERGKEANYIDNIIKIAGELSEEGSLERSIVRLLLNNDEEYQQQGVELLQSLILESEAYGLSIDLLVSIFATTIVEHFQENRYDKNYRNIAKIDERPEKIDTLIGLFNQLERVAQQEHKLLYEEEIEFFKKVLKHHGGENQDIKAMLTWRHPKQNEKEAFIYKKIFDYAHAFQGDSLEEGLADLLQIDQSIEIPDKLLMRLKRPMSGEERDQITLLRRLSPILEGIVDDLYKNIGTFEFENSYIKQNESLLEKVQYSAEIELRDITYCEEQGAEYDNHKFDYDKKEFVEKTPEEIDTQSFESYDLYVLASEIKSNIWANLRIEDPGYIGSDIIDDYERTKITFFDRYKFDTDHNMPISEAVKMLDKKQPSEEDSEGATFEEDAEYDSNYRIEKIKELELEESEAFAIDYMLNEAEFDNHVEEYTSISGYYSWSARDKANYLNENPIFKRFIEVAMEADDCSGEDIIIYQEYSGRVTKSEDLHPEKGEDFLTPAQFDSIMIHGTELEDYEISVLREVL